jgi:chemotaxis protein CheX
LQVGAKEVFQIMLQTELKELPNAQELTVTGNDTAMIGLAGALCGVMSIRCDSHSAEKMTGRMLGSVGAVDPKDVPDAIAEICNMVAGNCKSKITPLAENCMPSVPTVIRGDDYEMVTVSDGDQITLGLSYDGSPIWFCLAVHSQSAFLVDAARARLARRARIHWAENDLRIRPSLEQCLPSN